MLAKVSSAAVVGIHGQHIVVEADIALGLPCFSVVGLPDTAVREAGDRVRAAIKNSGFEFPIKRITINLAPADTKKEGSGFDLAVAVGILAASGQITDTNLEDLGVIGELSLDGSVRPVHGMLSMVSVLREKGVGRIIVPPENKAEAALLPAAQVYAVENLQTLVEYLNGERTLEPVASSVAQLFTQPEPPGEDFCDVKGQAYGKRAIEIAAAGGHNIVMIGPPGSGKTMLARRIPSILPPLSFPEALEVTKIYSVAGLLPDKRSLITTRPFRSPHHTISNVALIGGGRIPHPGEVSLAHNGILFLDELPEFQRNVLEVLRQPLEDGTVTIARALASLDYPADFMLVAALNPCPCGFFGDPERECSCTAPQIQRYLNKISGPLLDRIDIHVEVPRTNIKDLEIDTPAEGSALIRERVKKAREIQQQRFRGEGIFCNAQMQSRQLRTHCKIDKQAKQLLRDAFERLGLSARAHDRILKVARTIADLAGAEAVQSGHVAEAIQYRTLDRKLWA